MQDVQHIKNTMAPRRPPRRQRTDTSDLFAAAFGPALDELDQRDPASESESSSSSSSDDENEDSLLPPAGSAPVAPVEDAEESWLCWRLNTILHMDTYQSTTMDYRL